MRAHGVIWPGRACESSLFTALLCGTVAALSVVQHAVAAGCAAC